MEHLLEHVTATWEFLSPGHYAVAGKAVPHQPQDSHPVLVDLLAPDSNSSEKVEAMLTTVASYFEAVRDPDPQHLHQLPASSRGDMVFDSGEIGRW